MFQVVHKETGELRMVYGINGTMFLFWNHEEDCWEYDEKKQYMPVEVPV